MICNLSEVGFPALSERNDYERNSQQKPYQDRSKPQKYTNRQRQTNLERIQTVNKPYTYRLAQQQLSLRPWGETNLDQYPQIPYPEKNSDDNDYNTTNIGIKKCISNMDSSKVRKKYSYKIITK